jgi:tRNA threonylcarbamoyladenosine biosynthesis protein TsaE
LSKDKIITSSPEETKKLGEKIAQGFYPGLVVALFGPLGSGKTCFTQGICSGLGVKDFVVSPSFVLINEYQGKYKVLEKKDRVGAYTSDQDLSVVSARAN